MILSVAANPAIALIVFIAAVDVLKIQ